LPEGTHGLEDRPHSVYSSHNLKVIAEVLVAAVLLWEQAIT